MKITKSELKRIFKEEIGKLLKEGDYHDMGGEDEMYNVLDPHGLEKMSDAELVDMAYKAGVEESIRFDGEGGLVDRAEVIAVLQDV